MRRALPDVAVERRATARLRERLASGLRRAFLERKRRLDALATSLVHLDPTQVLGRGYSIVRDPDGHVRATSRGLEPGATLDITFSEGGAAVKVHESR
jgi:exodeoxyribonuclease VII large subunit